MNSIWTSKVVQFKLFMKRCPCPMLMECGGVCLRCWCSVFSKNRFRTREKNNNLLFNYGHNWQLDAIRVRQSNALGKFMKRNLLSIDCSSHRIWFIGHFSLTFEWHRIGRWVWHQFANECLVRSAQHSEQFAINTQFDGCFSDFSLKLIAHNFWGNSLWNVMSYIVTVKKRALFMNHRNRTNCINMYSILFVYKNRDSNKEIQRLRAMWHKYVKKCVNISISVAMSFISHYNSLSVRVFEEILETSRHMHRP